MEHPLTKTEIEALFTVDLEGGRLFWRVPSKYHAEKVDQEAGGPALSQSGKYYWVVSINGRKYKRAHLIFCLAHGRFPVPMADHKNGDSLDDSPSNLRDATATQNAWNHKKRKRRIALPMGVRATKAGTFEARIGFHKTQIHLGAFATPEAAHAVYLSKRSELYGEFA